MTFSHKYSKMIECINCAHFYYDNGGGGHCDMPYEHTCLKLLHKWHTNPVLFIENVFDEKLKWYQKIYLKILFLIKK